MPDQQLLEMRLETLEEYVAKVRAILSEANRRGRTLEQLEKHLATTGSIFRELSQAKQVTEALGRILQNDEYTVHDELERLQGQIVGGERYEDKSLPDQLRDLPSRLESIFNDLMQVKNALYGARKSTVQLDRVYIEQLESILEKRCTEIKGSVSDIRTSLTSGTDARSVWKQYENLVDTRCENLFADYVDFLGGLTLRDTALDGQVCAIADALLEEIHWESRRLALPSRRATFRSAIEYLVRLRFPEWTIWELPFVAHELGLSLRADHPPVSALLRDGITGHDPQFVKELFADAFAAYTMGPAYACASTLLRFQPQHDDVSPMTPSDAERATVIFGLLRLMKDKADDPYLVTVNQIESLWTEAVAKLVDPRPGDPRELHDFTDRAYASLVAESTLPHFEPSDWEPGMDSLGHLLPDPDAKIRSADFGSTVRGLINIAWGVRLNRPEDAQVIARNVIALWQHQYQPGHAPLGRSREQR